MAKLGEAYLELSANGSKLKQGIDQAKQATKQGVDGMTGDMKRLQTGIASAASKFLTITAAIGAFKFVSDAASDAEQAEADFTAALNRTGDATEANLSKFKALTADMQKRTIYEDDAILAQMALAKNIGVSTGQLEASTKAAIGLAARYKIDLGTAFNLVARASMGNTKMLKLHGIVLDETGTKAEKFAQLLKIGADSFIFAEAAAKTTAGRMEQMRNAIGDAAEKLGFALIPFMNAFAQLITPFAALLAEIPQGFFNWGLAIAAGVTAFMQFGKIMMWAKTIVDAFRNSQMLAQAVAQNWKAVVAALIVARAAIALQNSQDNAFAASIEKAGNAGASAMRKAAEETNALIDKVNKAGADAEALKEHFRDSKPPVNPLIEEAKLTWELIKAEREDIRAKAEQKRARIGFISGEEMYNKAAEVGAQMQFNGMEREQRKGTLVTAGEIYRAKDKQFANADRDQQIQGRILAVLERIEHRTARFTY